MRRRLNKRYLLLILPFTFACSGQDMQVEEKPLVSFQEWVQSVSKADSASRIDLVTGFMDSVSLPLIESDSQVYFIYQGSASSVAVAGDFTGWSPVGRSFAQLPGTDIWYRQEQFEPHARLDYKLVINGSSWILDPGNPNQISGGFGPNSELAMPKYVQPSEILRREGVAEGSLSFVSIESRNTGRDYELQVYLPSGYDPSASYPVVYFQDGGEYLSLANANVVLDNLIADQRIEPVIGIFVEPNDRSLEYAFADRFKYRDFFADELVPYIDSLYATDALPESRAVLGDSYGGNISAVIAFSRPELFGNCGIHSGAFQPNNFSTNALVMDGIRKNIKVASIWGTYEGSSLTRNMGGVRDYLIENGYDIVWKELPEGHSWGLWRATLDDMLIFFFSGS